MTALKTDEEIVMAIGAICAPLPVARKLRDEIIAALAARLPHVHAPEYLTQEQIVKLPKGELIVINTKRATVISDVKDRDHPIVVNENGARNLVSHPSKLVFVDRRGR